MRSKLRRIIGIDPGTLHTGFAVIVVNLKSSHIHMRARVEEIGSLHLSNRDAMTIRLGDLHGLIGGVVQRYQPHTAVIEKAFFGVNAASALKLGEARGAILTALTNVMPDIKLVEIAPAQVKKHITGNGQASKQQVAAALQRMLKFNMHGVPSDASDALALAFCHHLTTLPLRAVPGGLSTSAKPAPLSKRGRASLTCVPTSRLQLPKPQRVDPFRKN